MLVERAIEQCVVGEAAETSAAAAARLRQELEEILRAVEVFCSCETSNFVGHILPITPYGTK